MWILVLLLFAPFSSSIDLYVSGLFYTPGIGFYDNALFQALFKYGEIFGLATGGCAGALFLLSWVRPNWKKWRRGSLAMLLTLVLGAGLITNVILKGHWGRPRPKQIVEFGGSQEFRPFWKPHFEKTENPQKSFPSGHVAMGFYFLSLCLIGKRLNSKVLFRTGLMLTLLLGGGLMVARVAQGGHFVSDVLVAPLIMWYVAKASVALTWRVGENPQAPAPERNGTFRSQDGS